MSTTQDIFECPACQSTRVIRPAESTRNAPTCFSCSNSQNGQTQMIWKRTTTE